MLERFRTLLSPAGVELQSVRDWRQHVLSIMLGGLCSIGALVALPSAVLALKQGMWLVAVSDVVVLAVGTTFWLRRTWSLEVRAWGTCVLLYLLGLALMFEVGPTSQIYLMLSPVLAGILLGLWPAVCFLALNALTLYGVGYGAHVSFQLRGFEDDPALQWFVITLNFVFVNGVITATIVLLLRGLEKSFASAVAANRAKSEFLANMSHEIRTPMHAVLGMLKLTRGTTLTAQQFDYISKSEGAAKTLLALINDILDFSKIDAGKLEVERHAFRLDRLMQDLAVVLTPSGLHNSVDVLFDVAPDLPEVVLGDALRLQQVLTNLGGNAVKFTQQGQVVVSLRKVADAPTSADLGRIFFAVEDSGIGIAPEHQGRIFSGFTQAEGSTTRKFGGTGLGLVISQRLVRAMGGNLELQSTPGQGSRFYFTLDLPLAPSIPQDLQSTDHPLPAGLRVLVVDDNPLAAQLLCNMTAQWSGRSDIARGGAQALHMLEDSADPTQPAYDLVLLDCQMQEMDGWQTASHIRQRYAHGSKTRPTLLMVSASGRDTLAQRTPEEQALADGLLVKPVTARALKQEVAMARSGTSSMRKVHRAQTHQRALRGMRILVVEDNLINQQVAEELLAAQGAFVALAANGQLGVQAVAAARPQFDVVLMDVQMPVMDGYAATLAIRHELGLRELPIVGLTANALASDRAACLQCGMNEHVGKPYDLPQLVSLLIRLTGHTSKAAAVDAPQASDTEAQVAPEPVAAPATQEAWPSSPDIDVAPALQRLGGMEKLYARAATDFDAVLVTLPAQLHALALSGDAKALAASAHTYKGTAATLGLGPLSAALGSLEQRCKQAATPLLTPPSTPGEGQAPVQAAVQTQVQALVQDLVPRVASARAALAQVLQRMGVTVASAATGAQPGDAAAPAPPDAATQARIASLIALLHASDLGVLEAFATMREDLGVLPQAEFSRLENALQDLDLEEGLRACEAIVARGALVPDSV